MNIKMAADAWGHAVERPLSGRRTAETFGAVERPLSGIGGPLSDRWTANRVPRPGSGIGGQTVDRSKR